MMFPLVLFIFPTIFIVLMGPAILNALYILKPRSLAIFQTVARGLPTMAL